MSYYENTIAKLQREMDDLKKNLGTFRSIPLANSTIVQPCFGGENPTFGNANRPRTGSQSPYSFNNQRHGNSKPPGTSF